MAQKLENKAAAAAVEERILLLAPTGRDGEMLSEQLARKGWTVVVFQNAEELCEAVASGAGLIFLAAEALTGGGLDRLVSTLKEQPKWSDLPLVIMTATSQISAFNRNLEVLFTGSSNFTLLDRPIRLATLFSVVTSALKSRRRQYEVRALLNKTEMAVTQRDQFLAMLGHELRNPLAAMVSAVKILRDFGEDDPALAREQTSLLARQAAHMKRLVDDLLDVARVTSGKIPLNLERVDLRETAMKALETVKSLPHSDAHEIHFSTTSVPVIVEGDPVRLEQVIVNLLHNAVKYTPSGGKIWLSVNDGSEATLRVRDTGEGISPEMIERIFDPFAQVHPTLARSRGGLGIGLAVVRTLVEMHRGKVSVSSEGRGKGSEFVIKLPVTNAKADEPKTRRRNGKVAPKRILLVEDNADSQLALSRLLRLFGHHVETANDGREGLDLALNTEFDVILLDIGLPELDGYQVAAEIRSQVARRPVLMALTGYGQLEDQKRAKKAGFDFHLTKPVDPDELVELLGRVSERALR